MQPRRARSDHDSLEPQYPDQDQLQQLFMLSPDLLCIAGVDGYFKFLNPAWEPALGYALGELLARPYLDFVHPDDRASTIAAAAQLSAGGQVISFENRYRSKDGSVKWLLWSATPSPDGASVYAVARDISDRKRAEEDLREYAGYLEAARQTQEENAARLSVLVKELEAARHRAEQATRAKSDFLASVSHDIRTPMNSILGITELALNDSLSPEDSGRFRTIRDSANSLLHMIDDILDFSRGEARKLELDQVEFSLRDLVEDTLRVLAVRAQQRRIQMAGSVAPRVPQILVGDPDRLRRILMNLAANAVKFTERGEVILSADCEPPCAQEAVIHVSVRDTGIGIAAEKQEKIFRPFAQADVSTARKYGGSGLGLAICAQLVELMGGRIWVESEVGRGSTFHFTARLGTRAGQSPSRSTQDSLSATGKIARAERPLRVLLAEDDAVNQELVGEFLRRRGHAVTVVSSGRDALAALERQLFDAVLMDVQMPGLDGLETTRLIRQGERSSSVRVPIIAMTGRSTDADRDDCLAAGMDACVVKPIRSAALFSVLESVVAPRGEKSAPGECAAKVPEAAPASIKRNVPAAAAQSSAPAANALDSAALLRGAGGDAKLLARLIRIFLADAPRRMRALRRAVSAEDALGIAEAAHALKGSAANFGPNLVSAQATALDLHAREGNLSAARVSLGELEEEIAGFTQSLRALASQNKSAPRMQGKSQRGRVNKRAASSARGKGGRRRKS